jgi:hypothetical protein
VTCVEPRFPPAFVSIDATHVVSDSDAARCCRAFPQASTHLISSVIDCCERTDLAPANRVDPPRYDVPLACLSSATASETRSIVETRNPRPTSYTVGRLTSSHSSALANPEGLHRTPHLGATKRDRADPCHSAAQRKIAKIQPRARRVRACSTSVRQSTRPLSETERGGQAAIAFHRRIPAPG